MAADTPVGAIATGRHENAAVGPVDFHGTAAPLQRGVHEVAQRLRGIVVIGADAEGGAVRRLILVPGQRLGRKAVAVDQERFASLPESSRHDLLKPRMVWTIERLDQPLPFFVGDRASERCAARRSRIHRAHALLRHRLISVINREFPSSLFNPMCSVRRDVIYLITA